MGARGAHGIVSLALPHVERGGFWALTTDERLHARQKLQEVMLLPRLPTEKQAMVLCHPARGADNPVLFGGGKSGGKSTLLCMLAISLCRLVPKNRVLMCRRTYTAFSSSTLQELEEQIADVPEAHKYGGHEVHFDNGSEIWYMGVGSMKDIEKFGSTQFGAILIDEAPELDRDVFKELQQRLRHPRASEYNLERLVLTGNPYPGWVKEDFRTLRRPGYTFVRALIRDNPHTPPGYEQMMRAILTTEEQQAFLEGDWEALSPTDQAIPQGLIDAAVTRSERPDYRDHTWGIDVSRHGRDWTALWSRAGMHFERVDKWQKADIPASADRVCWRWLEADHRPARIVIDDNGVGGGLTDELKRRSFGGELGETVICGVIGNSRPDDVIHYGSKIAELVYRLRAVLEAKRGDFPQDNLLLGDLSAIRAGFSSSGGRRTVDSGEVIRGRTGRSPDDGYALLLTLETPRQDYIPGYEDDEDQYQQPQPDDPLDPDDDEALVGLTPNQRMTVLRERERTKRRLAGIENLFRQSGYGFGDPDDLGYY